MYLHELSHILLLDSVPVALRNPQKKTVLDFQSMSYLLQTIPKLLQTLPKLTQALPEPLLGRAWARGRFGWVQG